ncbi:MAG: anthranilate phosphoribosyltransferase [PVC group bacterium]|nr:anthranilate phosphoribosyltransferase [PVC group bacterium]
MIQEGIKKVITKKNLRKEEMQEIFTQIMQGEATPAQIAAFLIGLRMKGETVDEITGAAEVMRKFATHIKVDNPTILDTCGTGGDRKHTFNISTMTAIVASGAGVTVAKHGNRSVSSKSGSADLLEKLGVNLSADVAIVEKCVNEIGIGFLFAPTLHKAMKYAVGPRKEVGVRTIFNILGPLTNPANATNQLLGIFDRTLREPVALVLQKLGLKHALVVHGADGVDEVSTVAETFVCELKDNQLEDYTVKPERFNINRTNIESLQITDAQESASIANKLLDGEKGPIYDAVLLNSAFAIYAADKAPSVDEGIKLAAASLAEGKAKEKLNLLIKYTNENNS